MSKKDNIIHGETGRSPLHNFGKGKKNYVTKDDEKIVFSYLFDRYINAPDEETKESRFEELVAWCQTAMPMPQINKYNED